MQTATIGPSVTAIKNQRADSDATSRSCGEIAMGLTRLDPGVGIRRSLARDARVAVVQEALIALGFLSLKGNTSDGRTTDGKFGSRTYEALLAFRSAAGMQNTSSDILLNDIIALADRLLMLESNNGMQPVAGSSASRTDPRVDELEKEVGELRGMIQHAAAGSEDSPWFERINVKGDLRLRYQSERNSDGQTRRGRFRIRGRLGADFEINEKTSLHAGIATGSGDPRSTSVTLEGEFNAKQVNLDYAYGKLKLSDWVNIKAGKIKQEEVFWQPTDLVWDTDINPEGVAVGLAHKLDESGKYEVFLNAGHLFFGKSDFGLSGPSISFVQPGVKADLGNGFYAKASLDAFFYNGFQGQEPFKYSSGTNTLTPVYEYSYDEESKEVTRTEVGKVVKNDYDSVGVSVEAGKRFESGKAASVYGSYVNNYKASENNTGYAVGVKYGDEKIDDKGKWEVRALYRHLEKDACPDNLPDSDAFGGRTGTEGFKVGASLGISENVSVGASYYDMRSIDSRRDREQVVQMDFNIRFGGSKRKKLPPLPRYAS